ncbi:MAG: SH3 domain-containing protein, partial [Comamonadaceae bacterium]
MDDPRMIRMAPLPRRTRGLLLALLAALALPGFAQEAAVTRRATQLRDTPAETGRSLAALPAQAPVTRLAERQGPWVRARAADGTTGWLHLFDMASASAPAARADGAAGGVGDALRGVTGLFGRPQQPQTAT